MRAIIDNNLPLTLGLRIRDLVPDADVAHVAELGLQDESDQQLRVRWRQDTIAWISRDEDFWLDAPEQWAVVWISCHNPRLAFLRDRIAPVIADHLPRLKSSDRLLVTEDFASLM